MVSCTVGGYFVVIPELGISYFLIKNPTLLVIEVWGSCVQSPYGEYILIRKWHGSSCNTMMTGFSPLTGIMPL